MDRLEPVGHSLFHNPCTGIHSLLPWPVTALSSVPVPQVLKSHGLRPDESLGQNFRGDDHHLARIVEASGVQPTDEVLEVGAGLGSLTRHLAAAAKRVVAVELDGKLLPLLRETVRGYPNVEVVHADILPLRLADFFQSPGYLVVASIPYYLTSSLIRHLLEHDPRPQRLTLTIQREVAERACASPPEMSLVA